MNLVAIEEGVITLIDKDTGEPVAVIRQNGKPHWLTIKGEATFGDLREIFKPNAPQHGKKEEGSEE